MTATAKRAEYLAWACLLLSAVFFAVVFFVGRWSGIFAVSAAGYFALAAVPIWFALSLQFHQRSMAERERLDAAALEGAGGAETIFREGGGGEDLFVAARRLEVFEKWLLPVFSAVVAAYQLAVGLVLLRVVTASGAAEVYFGGEYGAEPREPLLAAIFLTVVAFAAFLLCRYATGMSRQPQWKPLRAGGSFLLAEAVICFALAVALAAAHFDIYAVLNFLAPSVAVLLAVLGAETALNVVLDVYRPRLKAQYHRSAFDSRFLGIFNEPGEILHTAAGAIDYQFGFKVSETWFYQLLAKAVVPLVLFAAAVQYLLTGVVTLSPDEEAIVERFGNPVTTASAGGESIRVFGPGLMVKWPWPIDVVRRYGTTRISQVNIGYVPKSDSQGASGLEPLLWGKSHHEVEHDLLVAGRTGGGRVGTVPVSLVKASIPVQYRIKDLAGFLYNHLDPEKLLEILCYRELAMYAAGSSIEADDPESAAASLLGAGRITARRVLTDRIQAAADAAGTGVEIVFVGLQGIHPPPEVAADYHRVVGAVQEKQALVLNAQADRNSALSILAGSIEEAGELYDLAAEYQKLRAGGGPAGERLAGRLDEAFSAAGGDIYRILRESRSYAFEKAALAKATGQRFASQLAACRAAPAIYRHQQRLAMLEEALRPIRKFVVAADSGDAQIFIIDVQEKLTPSLYDLTGVETQETEK
jgi:regulator of protease activity HflC (stomatin/prohibitin superfamily)